jgi:SAM-dependent methyltransferase
MIFGDYLKFALKHLQPGSRVLEIGSGLGHLTLEMARLGHHVIGAELSPASVDIARKTLANNTYTEGFGSLEYINSDLQSLSFGEEFDVVCFFLTLHHFDALDEILSHIKKFIKPGGTIIVVEPARDFFSKRNASIVAFLRSILAINGNWYEAAETPNTLADFDSLSNDVLAEYRDAKEKNEKEQSPNDNEAYAADMIAALNKLFTQTELSHTNSLMPRMVGGLRADTEEKTLQMARLLKLFDDYATANGFIEPGVMMYSGKK